MLHFKIYLVMLAFFNSTYGRSFRYTDKYVIQRLHFDNYFVLN